MGKPEQEEVSAPTTLDAALGVIEQMGKAISALEEEVASLQDDLENYDCDQCRELEDNLEAAEERGELLDKHIEDLVSVRHAIKRGTVNDDHLYRIETVLSHLDSGWMCRA